MNDKKGSIDGFIPRRPDSELGDHHARRRVINNATPMRKELKNETDLTNHNVLGNLQTKRELMSAGASTRRPDSRNDINASLEQLDDIDEPPKKKLSRKERRRFKQESRTKAQKIRRRIAIFIVWSVVIGILLMGGWLIYKTINASNSVLQGNIFDIIQNQPLKKDENGRSNILVFGTESEGHPGADLTDSIMVISIDQEKKDAYMVSLPRDLWVAYEETCTVGNQGKLNAAYFCASNDGEDKAAGGQALSRKAGEITGLNIQYYVHLNWAALIMSVDAVGGIDVTINSSDPRGILDRNFDWVCNFRCYYVNYKNGETVHLDGEHALALARARNASGGYGLPGGNFDREKNQQLIIKALLDKASSAGTLTNLGAVTGLLDALGSNLSTNFETKEVRTLMDIGSKVSADQVISISLSDEDEPLVTTGGHNGQSIVRPIVGLMDYSEIRAYIKRQISNDPFVKEEPNVTVMNGSGEPGIAQTAADLLTDMGFTVDEIANAPEGTYGKVDIYQISNDKPATAAKLAEYYGVTIKTTTPPVSVVGETDFLIIIGDANVIRSKTTN